MHRFSLSHLADNVLLRELTALARQDRATQAALLAHIAEADVRRLYAPAACPSMFEYCVRELHMSEDSAYKRITVARVARRFPAILESIADGRLSLSGVLLLAPHLTDESDGLADELIAAAAHKTNSAIKLLLAERFPQPDLPTLVQVVAESAVCN